MMAPRRRAAARLEQAKRYSLGHRAPSTTREGDLQTTPAQPAVVVLKSWRFGPAGRHRISDNSPGQPEAASWSPHPLPYGIQHLEQHGWSLIWSDQHMNLPPTAPKSRLVRMTERLGVPWYQVWSLRTQLRAAAVSGGVVLSIFESEGHGYALIRKLTRRRGIGAAPQVTIACWLTELLNTASPAKKRLYRWLYRDIDLIVVFSDNQVPLLATALQRDPKSVCSVNFGVDIDESMPRSVAGQSDVPGRGLDVLAVGRDRGRDWHTLIEATAGADWTIQLVTRPEQVPLADFTDHPGLSISDVVERDEYKRLIEQARVIVIPTHDRAYPTGQTVLLEAMAHGKAIVVTNTEAMRGYFEDGIDAVGVPVGDPEALRTAISTLLSDEPKRLALGRNARARADNCGGTRTMWSAISSKMVDISAAAEGS